MLRAHHNPSPIDPDDRPVKAPEIEPDRPIPIPPEPVPPQPDRPPGMPPVTPPVPTPPAVPGVSIRQGAH